MLRDHFVPVAVDNLAWHTLAKCLFFRHRWHIAPSNGHFGCSSRVKRQNMLYLAPGESFTGTGTTVIYPLIFRSGIEVFTTRGWVIVYSSLWAEYEAPILSNVFVKSKILFLNKFYLIHDDYGLLRNSSRKDSLQYWATVTTCNLLSLLNIFKRRKYSSRISPTS